jgi:hypothetical protein
MGEALVGAGALVLLARLAGKSEGGEVPVRSVVRLADHEQRLSKAVECFSLARLITGRAVQRQGLLEVARSLRVTALAHVNEAKTG